MQVAELRIRIKKHADGSGALTAVRPDGSVTWQRQKTTVSAFFALHDLTHYAVESVLGYSQAFYELLASGWDISDFGKPWARGPLPRQAGDAELIVGFLDTERASGERMSAEEFNGKAKLYFETHKIPGDLNLTDEHLINIRKRRTELFEQWAAIAPGGTLELEFDPAQRVDG